MLAVVARRGVAAGDRRHVGVEEAKTAPAKRGGHLGEQGKVPRMHDALCGASRPRGGGSAAAGGGSGVNCTGLEAFGKPRGDACQATEKRLCRHQREGAAVLV